MHPSTGFNSHIRQIMLLLLLVLLVFIVLRELYVFFPGLLGAITLYILSRGSYFQLVYHRKWRKGWTAGMYMTGFMLLLGLLIYFIITLLEKQVHPFLTNPSSTLNQAKEAIAGVQRDTGVTLVSEESLSQVLNKVSVIIPGLVNDTLNLLFNLAILLFVLYYMLVHGKEMEVFLARIIPLKKTNISVLAAETKRIVKVSALGIPIISLIQGITATIGYIIFGVNDIVLWGFLTGVFAFFPVVGTMIIWVPLVIFMYASGDTWNAVGLGLYSLIVTGNIDYLARITLLKKMGNIHPLITVIGVLVGLNLFGFIGLIFGPLLVNYIILLFRIYMNEFIDNKEQEPHSTG